MDTTTVTPMKQAVTACIPPVPPARCSDGERVDLTDGGCTPVGGACPSGIWPLGLPVGARRLFVRAGATGGVGSPGSPFGTVDEALAQASDGDVVVLGAGTYPGAWVIDRAVSVVGVCAAQVVLEGPVSTLIAVENVPESIEGTFQVIEGGELTLRGVTIRGQRHGLHLLPGSVATVTAARFDQNTDRAILVEGGTLSLSDAVVERTLPRLDGTKGRGLQVNLGGQADATDVTFQDGDRGDVAAFGDGSTAWLTNCVLQNTRAEGDGYGIVSAEGALVGATTSAIQRKRGVGVYAVTGGTAVLEQSYVAHMEPDTGGDALGARVDEGSTLQSEDTLWYYLKGQGIYASGSNATLTLTRSTVAYSLQNDVETDYGRCIGVWDGARATLDAVHLGPSSDVGLYVSAAQATVQDLTVQGTELFGVLVQLGGRAEVTRGWSLGSYGAGFLARKGGELTLRDVRVDDPVEIEGVDGPNLGIGVMVDASSATFERVYVRHGQGAGVMLTDSTVSATGLVAEDTLSSPRQRENGVGVYLDSSTVTVDQLLVRRALAAGLYLGTEATDGSPPAETALTGNDVVVRNTLGQEKDDALGYGIVLATGATATIERVDVTDARTGGVVVMEGGEAAFSDLTVAGTGLGGGTHAVGYGMFIGPASHVTVERGAVQESLAAGVFINGTGGLLDAADLAISDTIPVDGENGIGLRVVAGAAAKLRTSAIEGSHAVGVLLQFAGALEAENLRVSSVASGALTSEDAFGEQRIEPVGSCLLATARSEAILSLSRFEGCAVLGALFDDSRGTLDDVQIDASPVGLAIQGFPEPTVEWSRTGLATNESPLMYRESSYPVPESAPPMLSPVSPVANAVRGQE